MVTIENGQLKVISPQDGSPAALAGIKPGDLIYSIDKEPVYDLTLGEAQQKLRGPIGSEVELTLRRGNGPPIDLKIKREPFKLKTVSARVLTGDIGYLRIAGFDADTSAALAGCGSGPAAARRQQADRLYPRSAEQSRAAISMPPSP